MLQTTIGRRVVFKIRADWVLLIEVIQKNWRKRFKNHTDVLIFKPRVCAGATNLISQSQISNLARGLRKNSSGMEENKKWQFLNLIFILKN